MVGSGLRLAKLKELAAVFSWKTKSWVGMRVGWLVFKDVQAKSHRESSGQLQVFACEHPPERTIDGGLSALENPMIRMIFPVFESQGIQQNKIVQSRFPSVWGRLTLELK